MAAVERGEGADEAIVRGWLAKAVTAPRGPQWICDNCSNTEPTWAPVCSNCGGFDTLSWKELPKSELSMPTGTEMLPLIVGKSPETATPPEEPEQVAEPVSDTEEPRADTEAVEATATVDRS